MLLHAAVEGAWFRLTENLLALESATSTVQFTVHICTCGMSKGFI